MNDVITKLGKFGLIPVIKINDAANAVPLAKALCEGGLPVAEITFRTPCAAEAIQRIVKEVPEMIVGAGTVLSIEQCDRAINAGAAFIVSPGINPKVVSYCQGRKIPMLPGCSSPTDLEMAIELGLDTVKFFPAEAAGGLAMIKAMSAPYSGIKFMPTGGINEDNLLNYLRNEKVIACGGSFMVKEEYVNSGDFDKIRDLTRMAVNKMYGFGLKHVGVNCENAEEAEKCAKLVGSMFGFARRETPIAVFGGEGFEFMKSPFLGTKGHIGIGTNFLDRAMEHFMRMGFEFDLANSIYSNDGQLLAAYFKDEMFGFAFHLSKW